MFRIGSKLWPGLSKLGEEANEVGTVCFKIIGVEGAPIYWDGTNLRNRLAAELGDLHAALDYFVMHALTPAEQATVAKVRAEKFELYMRWHEEQKE